MTILIKQYAISKLYKIYNPVKTQFNQITRTIITENKGEKNIYIDQPKVKTITQMKIAKTNTNVNAEIKKEEKTKLEKKIDMSKYKRPTIIHENHISTMLIQDRDNSNNNNLLKNIKNKYLLKQMLDFLQKEKLLNIIRYNKEIQNRFEININDYIKCSKIEIEIILWEGKKYFPFSFINISKEDEAYFHIYFNDSKEEIKKYSLGPEENVIKIKVIIDYEVKSLNKLFNLCYNNKKITFKKFNINDIKDMSYMFSECSGLIELNLSNFDTSNVTDMSGMFYNCQNLKVLNLTNFSTNKVNNMSRMFQGCINLKQLDLSNFDTNNVTNMYLMFAFCGLESLNLSNFNTKNVVDMSEMFTYCSWLEEINISNFIINKATKWNDMFEGCSGLLTKKIVDKIKIIK